MVCGQDRRAESDMKTSRTALLAWLALAASLGPRPACAQRRAMTIEDYLALPSVGDPQLSPDGKWVAYAVTRSSQKENRSATRIWLAEVAGGQGRQFTAGPGSDRQPRWSPDGRTLAFVSTRENGAQLWLLPLAGGEARRVTSVADGVSDPIWLPDGSGVLVTSDLKWPREQELDRRNGEFPTEARLWTNLMWRHWDEWRAGRRQHLFLVALADGSAQDLTPADHDVPTIATGGDGDVAVSPEGSEIAVAMHGDSTVADNTNVDIYLIDRAGGAGRWGALRQLTTNRGADNTPRYSPDGKWLAYLSMERPGFEADRLRLMLLRRTAGKTESGPASDATAGWMLSIGSFTWCPESTCLYAVVEERGRDHIYRIEVPSFRRTAVPMGGGVNTNVKVLPGGAGVVYLHQSNTQPAELWAGGRQLSHVADAGLDLNPLEEYGFVARGYVVAAVNFHGSTGYGQRFTDAISQHWGDYPFTDLMKGLDVVARLPYVDSTRMGAAGASYGGYIIYWLVARRPHRSLQGVRGARRRLQPGEHGGQHRRAMVRQLGVRRHAVREPHAVREVVSPRLRPELEDSDADRALATRLPGGPIGGVPGLHGREGVGRACQIPLLSGRGALGDPAAQPAAVVWGTVLDWLDQYLQPRAAAEAR
jgi:dipeptidyl aminopeptidase/acylaminoacyl peptidase